MKGLLQSKRFRKNLKKWLCMYVGTLLILTTVITYSKYISSLGLNDESRVTKFDVEINQLDMPLCSGDINTSCCNNTSGQLTCTTNEYRPTEKITYKFEVVPNFEVNTLLVTSIYIPENFEVLSIKENDDTLLYDKDNSIVSNVEINNQTIEIKRNVDVSQDNPNIAKSYEVVVKYIYDENTYNFDATNKSFTINVGYSATQVLS